MHWIIYSSFSHWNSLGILQSIEKQLFIAFAAFQRVFTAGKDDLHPKQY